MTYSTTKGYQQKYADKIALMAKKKGCSVETLVAEASATTKEIDLFAIQDAPMQASNIKSTSKIASVKPVMKPTSRDGVPVLDSLINVDNFRKESRENVGKLWTLLHSSNPSFICGVVEPAFYALLSARGKLHPTFVLPLQKETGCEFMLMQFSGPQIQFTQLSSYQANPQSAQPCLTMTHYDEVEGVVLMRGELDLSVVNAEEARRLAYLVQMFYGNDNKTKVVEAFSKGEGFDYRDIIAAADVLA